MITVRRAGEFDAREMAGLLDAIIRKGGTTAHTKPVSRDSLLEWMHRAPTRSAWFVAETDAGEIKGFQFIEPHHELGPDVGDIATFVAIGETGFGIGSKLFEKTKSAAQALGYRWINATIRADNAGGLAYYQSRGFEDYAFHPDVPLANGQIVDRISKRFDLT
ncbi:GNAT family N-acetyltransferase [Marivita geojedonensis]|uniref:Acetyltransferase n=2 Tax=Marivita geojedonensis TaxID=1123756 RepID=A0A1X4NJG9_9RHOB|nr:GNAT family N-acetyltransferase [Marivita geojedonensis]OSQ49854.1 acetyltransferase [Marivita geojedonensis]PRY76077.1 L-amino acid N-acyltransferase YncA [Marivita geojedonensis]